LSIDADSRPSASYLLQVHLSLSLSVLCLTASRFIWQHPFLEKAEGGKAALAKLRQRARQFAVEDQQLLF